MLEQLKEEVCAANKALVSNNLVTLTWGNVSGIDREQNLVVIKASGIAYEQLQPEHMVVVDMEGQPVEGDLRPSSDTLTHVLLYQAFQEIGGITHTHSRYGTVFAQARREIPCLGTTHADHFYGPIPVTRPLTADEVQQGYEANTGHVIIERFEQINPVEMPAVLVAGHAPFAWGPSASKSVQNAVALEAVAEMALATQTLCPQPPLLEDYVLEKHYQRKHGPMAYYGQTGRL